MSGGKIEKIDDRKMSSKKMISLMAKASLKSGRLRNIFVMVTIVLASALLTAILMFGAGQSQKAKRDVASLQQVGYYNLTEEQAQTLAKDERIAYQIRVKTGVLSPMEGFDLMPYYVSELSDEIRIGELESGRLPREKNEIAVQKAMLERMGMEPKEGAPVGLTFYDGTTETFTVTGFLKGSADAKQFSAFFSEDYAREGSQLKDSPYEVYAKLYGAAEMSEEDCREAMYLIGSDAGIERKNVGPVKAFLDTLTPDAQMLTLEILVGGVILLACVLVIYGVFYLAVIGRIHQFGQLRTIGMTKKQMKKLVSKEGGLLFARAVPLGMLIGAAAGYAILPEGFDWISTVLILVLVFAVIYVITMLSVMKPAKIASSVSPMEALRYALQDGMKRDAAKKKCRNLTPMGLGIMNFSRNRKKAAITMCSLALGGLLFMTAATYISSFDKENYARQGNFTDAEFVISIAPSAIELEEYGISGILADNPMDADMVGEIERLDGVKKVTEQKNFGIKFDVPAHDEYGDDDFVYPLTAQETEDISSYLESGSIEEEQLMSGNAVLAAGSQVMEEIFGWSFEVGDQVIFHFYDGNKMIEKQMEIAGILNDDFGKEHTGMEGWFVMPEEAILKMASYDSLNASLLVSTDPKQEEEVGETLEQMVQERPQLTIETLAERRVAYEQSANQTFGAISGLSIFIMLFSILSMMNTLITNIVTRKQELAMLESIGMSKGQIRKMLLGESLLLVISTVGVTMTLGTLCGYVLCKMLYDAGAFYMEFSFPWAFAAVYVAVLAAVPLLITIASMKSFAKEALVERLRGVEC